MNNGFFYTDLVSSIASTSANVKPNPIADFTDTELHLLDWPPCYVHEDLLKFNDKSRPVTPPRPQNAWVLYRKNFEKCLRLQNPDGVFRVKDVSKKASLQWKEEPSEVKQYFCALSKFAQYVHRYTYPYYVYHPKRRKRENKEYRFKVIGSKEYGRREIIKEAANKRTDEGNGESAGRTETSSEECNLINENTVGVVPVENVQLNNNVYVNVNDSSFFSYSLGPGYYMTVQSTNDATMIDTNQQSIVNWTEDNGNINFY